MPEVLALDVLGGNVVLVQTAVRGRPQNARLVHADLSGVVGEVEPWLLAAPCTGTADREWAQRQLEEPLERLAAASPGLRGDVESTRAATQSLVAAELPLVLEHGDLREGNLLRSRTGLAVVDWELGRQDGLVLADLVIFSTYVLGCALRTHAPDRLARELVASVDDRWSPLRALLVAHLRAREVGIEWLRPLILASWARYVARLPDRLGEGGAGVLLEVPEVTLWRHLARWAVRQSIRWRS